MFYLVQSEIRQMLAAVDLASPFGKRDYLLVLLFFHTGLRVSEMAALTVADVAHQGEPREWLEVGAASAKGHKRRVVPLNSTARQAVAKLLAFNRSLGLSIEPAAPLFQTRFHERLWVRDMQRIVAALREKAGLDFKASPHTLRHSYATRITENVGDTAIVKALLGHARLTSTQVYVHPNRERLVRAVQSLAGQA